MKNVIRNLMFSVVILSSVGLTGCLGSGGGGASSGSTTQPSITPNQAAVLSAAGCTVAQNGNNVDLTCNGTTATLTPPAGPTGATGAASTVAGPQGPQGPQGPTGAASTVAGPAGPQGPAGATGATGAASTVAGPAGPAGPAGAAGTNGSSFMPMGTLGTTVTNYKFINSVGNYAWFFNTTTNDILAISNLNSTLFAASQVYYSGVGCTGTAMVQSAGTYPYFFQQFVVNGTTTSGSAAYLRVNGYVPAGSTYLAYSDNIGCHNTGGLTFGTSAYTVQTSMSLPASDGTGIAIPLQLMTQ